MANNPFVKRKSADQPLLAADAGTLVPSWTAPSNLTPGLELEDLYGLELGDRVAVSRLAALQVPGVVANRNLIVSTIAKLPLVALNRDGALASQPSFLYRSDFTNPYTRLAMTVDDLLFYGVSLWLTDRGAKQADAAYAPILSAEWIPRHRWTVNSDGYVVVDNLHVLQGTDFVLFEVPGFPGLLNIGASAIRAGLNIEKAHAARAEVPPAWINLSVTDQSVLSQEEADAWVLGWSRNHRAGQVPITYTPPGTQLDYLSGNVDEGEFFESARNANRVDIAAFLNVPAWMSDAATQETQTYSNAEGTRSRFLDQLSMWTAPIEYALSDDKCVPRGQRVRFDASDLSAPTPAATGIPTED